MCSNIPTTKYNYFRWFERVTMSVIVINCVTLGSYQPCRDISVCDGKCQILKIVDDVIFAYFAAEMIIKMVGNNHIISLIITPPHIFPRWPWECLVEGAT